MVSTRSKRASKDDEASPLRSLSNAPKSRKPRAATNKLAGPKPTTSSPTSNKKAPSSTDEISISAKPSSKTRTKRVKKDEPKKAVSFSEPLATFSYASTSEISSPYSLKSEDCIKSKVDIKAEVTADSSPSRSPPIHSPILEEISTSRSPDKCDLYVRPMSRVMMYEGRDSSAPSGTIHESVSMRNIYASPIANFPSPVAPITGPGSFSPDNCDWMAMGKERSDNNLTMIWLWEDFPKNSNGAQYAARNSPTAALVVPTDMLIDWLSTLPNDYKKLTTFSVKEISPSQKNLQKRKFEEDPKDTASSESSKRAKTNGTPQGKQFNGYYRQRKRAVKAGYDRKGNLILPGQELPEESEEVEAQSESEQQELAADRRYDAKLQISGEVADPFVDSTNQGTFKGLPNASASTSIDANPQYNTHTTETTTPSRWGFSNIVTSVGKLFPFGRHSVRTTPPTLSFRSPSSRDQEEPTTPTPINARATTQNLGVPPTIERSHTEDSDIVMSTPAPLPPVDSALSIENWGPDSVEGSKPQDKNADGSSHVTLQVNKAIAENNQITQRQLDAMAAELEQRKKEMEAEIERKVAEALKKQETTNMGLSNQPERKRKRRQSVDVIPQPEGASYGFNEEYMWASYSSSEDDEYDESPEYQSLVTQKSAERPTKRTRVNDTQPSESTTPKFIGSPKEATPYTGQMFSDHKPNVFGESNRFHYAKVTEEHEETEILNPNVVTYTLPSPSTSDDESDQDKGEGESTVGSTSQKQTMPSTTSSAPSTPFPHKTDANSGKPSASKQHIPPPAPTPAHAVLPSAPGGQNSALAQARAQATRYAPKQPSALRESSRLSTSTVASGDDGMDQDNLSQQDAAGHEEPKRPNILVEKSGNEGTKVPLDLDTKMAKVWEMIPECQFEKPAISNEVQEYLNSIEIPAFPFADIKKAPQWAAKDPKVIEHLNAIWGPADEQRAKEVFETGVKKLSEASKH